MSSKSIVTHLDGMSFNVELQGYNFKIDSIPEYGGQNKGPTPKPLLLSALGGCTGMDVVSILKKMKLPEFKLQVEVEGFQKDVHPKVYTHIIVRYKFEGEGLSLDKIEKAVHLSETQYCGVSAMLSKSAELSAEIYINGEKQ